MGAIDQAASRLVADVGGTNTRIALYDPASDEYRALHTYRNEDYATWNRSSRTGLTRSGSPPPVCCIAAAAPPSNDRVTMLNIDWSFSCSELARQFGFVQAGWLNDFQANAYALALPAETSDRVLLQPGSGQAGDKLATMGPGTGLGGACLDR